MALAIPSTWLDVRGWLTEPEGHALARLAENRDVLELGTWCGRSACCMAAVARRVTCVDTYRGDESTGHEDTLGELCWNLHHLGHRENIVIVRCDLSFYQPEPESADLVYIDSAHDTDSVVRDVAIARRAVRPGGVIAWHDCEFPSVVEGIQKAGLSIEGQAGHLAWSRV